jgi:hypothetical protein
MSIYGNKDLAEALMQGANCARYRARWGWGSHCAFSASIPFLFRHDYVLRHEWHHDKGAFTPYVSVRVKELRRLDGKS